MKMKKLLKIFMFMLVSCSFVSAQQDMTIIPDSNWDVWNIVREIATWGQVWSNYRTKVKEWNMTLWEQFSSGIMSRDTILDYCVYLAKFLWQVALLVWALALIYLWYQKIRKSIKWEALTPFTKVVIWILVIVFAYVIVKVIRSAFIS